MTTKDITARLNKLSEQDYTWLKDNITETWFSPSGFIEDIYQDVFDPENFNPDEFLEDEELEYINNIFGSATTHQEAIKIIEFLRNEKDSGVSYPEMLERLHNLQ